MNNKNKKNEDEKSNLRLKFCKNFQFYVYLIVNNSASNEVADVIYRIFGIFKIKSNSLLVRLN